MLALVDGQTTGLAEHGVVLGGSVPALIPGKLEEGRSILATDGQHGGAAIYRTQRESLLVLVYGDTNPDAACRMAAELAEYMDENNL